MPATLVSRLPLSERLRPIRWEQFFGNPAAIDSLRRWGKSWARGIPRRRAVLLEGPAGVGKTSAALALAAEMGWGVVEMNASDARNRHAIEQVAGRASLTSSLDPSGRILSPAQGGRTLILIDEADCLTGRAREEAKPRAAPQNLREFLRTRYGSVAALNQGWHLGKKGGPSPFEHWDDLPATAGRAAWTKLPEARRDLSDWKEAGAPRDLTDRGGLGAIARLVRETRQPVVLTVNDARELSREANVFRSFVQRISFDRVPPDEVRRAVRRWVLQESIALHATALDMIVRRSEGDLRSAVNDLEAIAPLPASPNQGAVLAPRDRTDEFFHLTDDVFSTPRVWRSGEVRDRLDSMPDDLLPWIEENLPRYVEPPRARADSFSRLAEAERLLALARRRRIWALWSFATELMTGGVSLAGGEGVRPTPPVSFPQFLSEMGRSRMARATRAGLALKLGHAMHLSKGKAIERVVPVLETLLKGASASVAPPPLRRVGRRMVAELELAAEEVALLLGADPMAPEVGRLLSASEPEPKDEPDPAEPPKSRVTLMDRPRESQRRLGEF